MEAKNFRIGNVISESGLPKKINTIGDTTFSVKGKHWKAVLHEEAQAIPLTEEWLLNLGFNKDYQKGYIGIDVGNTDFVLTYPKIMGDFQECFAFQFHSGGWSKFREVKYVHELQNLFFAITGQELELKDVRSTCL